MPPRSKDSATKARAYALKLLSYRSRSRKEMVERLVKKGFASTEINSTVKFLEDIDLINDRALASDLFRHSIESRSLGKRGIRTFLFKRGIDKDLIDEALSNHTTEIEERSAFEFAGRKLNALKRHPENVIRRRLWGMLQRRGYSIDVIKRTVDSLL